MMPTVRPNGMGIYYEVPGEGDPLVLIPYLAAGQACCAFQAAEYARHFGGPVQGSPVRQAGWHLHHRAACR